jgi:hypothetical protein
LCHKPVQVEEDSDKVLAEKKGILYMVFQVHQVVNGGSVALKSALGIRKEVSTLQDPDKTTVYHTLHYFTQATGQDDGAVTS